MNKYLPSKQFVYTIMITLIVGGVLLFAGRVLGKKMIWQQKDKEEITLAEGEGDFFAIDTDSDGLYDWEEALWNTNPNLKDTDNDGVDDKIFVENRRKELDVDNSYEPDDTNQTEVFAKQLFATSAVLNQSGSLSQEDLDKFSRNLDLTISSFNIKDKYTIGDLKLGSVSADTYYENFIAIYDSLPNKDIEELATISKIIENPNDPLSRADLAKLLSLYNIFQEKMLVTEVSYSNSANHLSIMNNLHRIYSILEVSVKISSDPLLVATYLSTYNEYSESLTKDFDNLTLYFSQNGIIESQ